MRVAMADEKNEKRMKKTVTGKRPEEIITDPEPKDIKEHVVVAFGRFNPPTIGHAKLVEEAKKLGVDVQIYLSHKEGKDDPIPYDRKVFFCQEAFGEVIKESEARNLIEVLESLTGQFRKVTVVVGEDRKEDFARIAGKYNGSLFQFESIECVSVGSREGSSLVENVSASKVRQLALSLEDFAEFIPLKLESYQSEILDYILEANRMRRLDYVMTKTTGPNGKPIWRKMRRILRKDVKGEDDLTTESRRFLNLHELSVAKLHNYFDKAATDIGKADKEGDEKRLAKRLKGAATAVEKARKKMNEDIRTNRVEMLRKRWEKDGKTFRYPSKNKRQEINWTGDAGGHFDDNGDPIE